MAVFPLEVVEAWQLPLARPEVLLLGGAGTIPAAHYSDVKVAAVYLVKRCLTGGLVAAAEVLHANEFRGAKAVEHLLDSRSFRTEIELGGTHKNANGGRQHFGRGSAKYSPGGMHRSPGDRSRPSTQAILQCA